MKKLLLLFMMACTFGAKAQSVRDYVYTSALEYDEIEELSYFDVYLEGDNYYTGYGMDIQLPKGLEVATPDGDPFVVMLDADFTDDVIYPKTNRKYTHSVTPSIPYSDDKSHLRVACISTANKDLLKTSGGLFRVYVNNTYTSGWPVGSVKLFAVELGKVGSHHNPADREDIVLVHTGETTLPLNISSAAKWSTCILPFSAAVPEGVKAYTCSSNDENYIYLSAVESLEAFTPYVLYSENGYSGTINGEVAETVPTSGVVSDNYLSGAIVPQTATKGYVLQNQGNGVKFYAIDDGDSFTIPAGKCWLSLQNETQAKALGFIIDDTTTGINPVVVPTSNTIFDISGRQVNNAVNGLFIKNGKKIIIK